jgi:hypothetical protein
VTAHDRESEADQGGRLTSVLVMMNDKSYIVPSSRQEYGAVVE